MILIADTLKRLSASHDLGMIARFELRRFDMTRCIDVSVLDHYCALIGQV